uniref:Molybdopterin-synthase adenylyltransferase n=1 Tax=Chlorobium chlorochromatii (strain CaD3) TaxID=340177 RepID=Q3AR44_CHLCH
MPLNPQQRQRYARHLALPEIGEDGQERLLASKVLIVGVGGLGSPAAFYLAAAGVGTLGLMDGDVVDESNLQRQILHTSASVGELKVASAAERLQALDPALHLITYPFTLTTDNAEAIIAEYDFVIDATDNFRSKFLIADGCHRTVTPYSHGGIKAFYGHTITVHPRKTTCYRCLFHNEGAVDNNEPQGPLGALPGIIGSLQATEALKHLLNIGTPLTNTLLTCDILTMNIRKIPVSRNPHCPLCGSSL